MAVSSIVSLSCLLLAVISNVSAQSSDRDVKDGIWYYREALQVYKFVSQDYSAMFVLTGGIALILAIAIVFIVVGLLTMDPGKDSIIYRMTTTRMKKD